MFFILEIRVFCVVLLRLSDTYVFFEKKSKRSEYLFLI